MSLPHDSDVIMLYIAQCLYTNNLIAIKFCTETMQAVSRECTFLCEHY